MTSSNSPYSKSPSPRANCIHALCVGAGPEQVPTIAAARKHGLHVIAVDGNPQAPGLAVADVGCATDIADENAVLALARQWQVSLVVPAPLGRWLTTVGAVNDALGLRGITRAAAAACTDKVAFHESLLAAGLRRPLQHRVHNGQDLRRSIATVGFPCIVKPRFGSGKKGVVAVLGPESVEQAVKEHYESWSRDSESLVEPLVPGQEVGIDGVVIGGKLTLTLVREKLLTPLPYRQEVQYLAPARLSVSTSMALRLALEQAVRALGLDNCLLNADVLIDSENNCQIIELVGRPGGQLITNRLIPAVHGLNVLREFIRFQLGEQSDFSPRFSRPLVLSFLRLSPGHLDRVPDEQELIANEDVLSYQCLLQPGSRLSPITCSRDVLARGHMMVTADTHEEALARIESLLGLFRVLPERNSYEPSSFG